ncbi:hypothetical protein MIND_00981000 [Mycena indigotica]|uniref:Uncharacterized protein n=1 Tax=Mycena indigotica TaxID=2126181 RepID=A0A8H6SEI3_9AGAR|nr:uncharacterized protein MIND_00981000 [Mycena indigotica]KAF7297473.1 hypothetical protein MIND_00981000 [Mycena indigotica]
MPGLSLDSPLSLYSIPAMWATAFAPVVLRTMTIMKTKGYNNLAPRGNTAQVANDKAVPPAVAARIQRLEGAHYNGMENFPLWASAVLAANYAGLDNRKVNTISLVYILGRVLYNYFYITQRTVTQSNLRSVVFFGILPLPVYLLISAASKVASG